MKLLLKTMLLCALALPHVGYAQFETGNDDVKKLNERKSKKAGLQANGFLSESATVQLELEKKGVLTITTEKGTLKFNDQNLTDDTQIIVTTNLLEHAHSLSVTPGALVLNVKPKDGETTKAAPEDREVISYTATLVDQSIQSNKAGEITSQIKRVFSPTDLTSKFSLKVALDQKDFERAKAGTFSGQIVVNVTSQT